MNEVYPIGFDEMPVAEPAECKPEGTELDGGGLTTERGVAYGQTVNGGISELSEIGGKEDYIEQEDVRSDSEVHI